MKDELKPYRVEWRANLQMRWMRIVDLNEHPGDLKTWVESQGRAWMGCYRLISQHVIMEANA